MAATTTKKRPDPISPEDFQSLTELREMLDQQTEEAIQAQKPYIAGVLTEILARVDKEVHRVNRYSGRISVADKRDKVRTLRKVVNGTSTNANPSHATA